MKKIAMALFAALAMTMAVNAQADDMNPVDADAQVKLGSKYDRGRGVPQNYVEAVKWYRKAADQGNSAGQNNLGAMYYEGLGVPQSDAEALKWYRKAAVQGHAMAQNSLGVMYAKGRGVSQNETEAIKWFRKAADQGNTDAQNNLASREERRRSQAMPTAENNAGMDGYCATAGRGSPMCMANGYHH